MKVTYGRRVNGKIVTITLKARKGAGIEFPNSDKVSFLGDEYTLIPKQDDLYGSILAALKEAQGTPNECTRDRSV